MLEYWIIKTSPKTHINYFLKIIKHNGKIGDNIILDWNDIKYPSILINGIEVIKIGVSATKQMLTGWQALGLIVIQNDKFIIACELNSQEKIFQFSKIFLLMKSKHKRINNYRKSKLVNSLIEGKIYTFSDFKAMGIKQLKGIITKEKIVKEISNYEREMAKDSFFLSKAKEVIDAI